MVVTTQQDLTEWGQPVLGSESMSALTLEQCVGVEKYLPYRNGHE